MSTRSRASSLLWSGRSWFLPVSSCAAPSAGGSSKSRWPNAEQQRRSGTRDVAGIVRLAAEDTMHDRLERLERPCRIIGVERGLIPALAEVCACPEPLVRTQPLAGVAVTAQVVRIVVGLKETVLLH